MFANMLAKIFVFNFGGAFCKSGKFAHAFNRSYVVFLHDMYNRAEDYTV